MLRANQTLDMTPTGMVFRVATTPADTEGPTNFLASGECSESPDTTAGSQKFYLQRARFIKIKGLAQMEAGYAINQALRTRLTCHHLQRIK